MYFGDSGGTARLVDKAYIGIPSVVMVNLIPAIDGANGWSKGTSSTAQRKYSTRTILLTSTTSMAEITTNTVEKIPLIAGHKYYIRVEVFFSTATTVRRSSCYWPIAEPSVWNSSQKGWTINAGTWRALSLISDRGAAGFSTGEYEFRVDFDNDRKAGQMWIDGVMCVDLTAAFGAGNEPDQSWCDSLPYFVGTYEMASSTAPGRAREIKKAYLGVDGVAKLVYTG